MAHGEQFKRVNAQCERIEELLRLPLGRVRVHGDEGLILTPDQADALLALVPDQCQHRCREG